ncbi:prepilin peptidase, partial [Streptomyces goshikiensis]
MSVVVITLLAAAYGAAGGLLLPRAAYRLSVAPGEPWRAHCPAGHPVPRWLGPARCHGAPYGASAPGVGPRGGRRGRGGGGAGGGRAPGGGGGG